MTQEIKRGDILLCRGKRPISKAIMAFLRLKNKRSKWTHTAIVTECWGELFIVDAQSNGVNPRPFKDWKKEFNYEFEIVRPTNDYYRSKAFMQKVYSKVGFVKYDFTSLLFWQPIYILFGKWKGKKSPREAMKRFYCSEHVGWAYDLPEWWKLSPQAVADIICNNENFKIVNDEKK